MNLHRGDLGAFQTGVEAFTGEDRETGLQAGSLWIGDVITIGCVPVFRVVDVDGI